jgi:hypothetical protein
MKEMEWTVHGPTIFFLKPDFKMSYHYNFHAQTYQGLVKGSEKIVLRQRGRTEVSEKLYSVTFSVFHDKVQKPCDDGYL